jgi:hypothetical protein
MTNADQLEHEIEETRSHLDQTLNRLHGKLTRPGLANEVLGYDRYRSGLQDIIEVVRRNPVPALLIAAGVGWLLYGLRQEARSRSRLPGPSTPRSEVPIPALRTSVAKVPPPIVPDSDLGVPPRF